MAEWKQGWLSNMGAGGAWASSCAACNQWPSLPYGDRLCRACQTLLAPSVPRCQRCALPLGSAGAVCQECLPPLSGLSACAAALSYEKPFRDWIHRFKHRGEPEWAGLFARLMLDTPDVRHILNRTSVWLPVPMSASALGRRGYNHTWELTQSLADVDAFESRASIRSALWLIKTAETPPQHTLTRSERLVNLRHAFALSAAGAKGIVGQHVVLIDDVMTTGATLECAAAPLLKHGALSVSAVILARTPKPVAA